MAYESVRSELAAMRRDLRWMGPVWIGLGVVLGVWRAVAGDTPGQVAGVFARILGLGVVLTPLVWLRYRGAPKGRRQLAVGAKLMGLALAWWIVAGAIAYGLAALLPA